MKKTYEPQRKRKKKYQNKSKKKSDVMGLHVKKKRKKEKKKKSGWGFSECFILCTRTSLLQLRLCLRGRMDRKLQSEIHLELSFGDELS